MSASVTFVWSLVLWHQICNWPKEKGPHLLLLSVTECSWTYALWVLHAPCRCMHCIHDTPRWFSHLVAHPCRMQEWRGALSSVMLYPWSPAVLIPLPLVLVRNAISRVSSTHLHVVHFPGASQRNKGWLFLLWLICITCCPEVSAILDLYLATFLKSNKMEPGFVLAVRWIQFSLQHA